MICAARRNLKALNFGVVSLCKFYHMQVADIVALETAMKLGQEWNVRSSGRRQWT